MTDIVPSPQPGLRLGPYELQSALGAGGMGDVWKARDTRVDRLVAIKFCHVAFGERFEREARAIASLNHPNICQLYDVGSDYLVMEFIDGSPVRPPHDWRKLLDIALQIANGLAAAHAAGIVHRDLKPENILVTRDGRVKILDFGLAKQTLLAELQNETRTTGHVTRAGTIVGTTAYMSPEQARGQELDVRSDQFSFGLVLYELAAGKRAFDRPSTAETMAAIIRDEPERLPAEVPPPLAWIIERCLAKEPDERYESTRDLYQELRALREHLSDAVKWPSAALPAVQRPRWFLQLSIGALLLVAGIAAGALWQSARRPAEQSWIGTGLGGPRVAISPRLSPDGQWLAFIALIDGVTQLGVMKPGASGWTLLTHGAGDGYVQNVSWSRDGSKLYFDRFWGQPIGVYTIPPLGGEPVLLLEHAFQPQALPDGSLLVLKISGSSDQLYRFWPDTGRQQALPVFLVGVDVSGPIAAFPDGRHLAFYGWSGHPNNGNRALQVLDIESGRVRPLHPDVEIDDRTMLSLPIAVTPDNAAVITLARRGGTYDLIDVPSDGSSGHHTLLSLRPNDLPWNVEAATDGSIYVDQVGRPYSILNFGLDGAPVRQIPAPWVQFQIVLPLSDGRIVAGIIAGKSRVVIGPPDGELRSILQTEEEAGGPLALAGADAVALMVGPVGHRRLAIVSIANGRILSETSVSAGDPSGIAVSPDRETFYYAEGGVVYAKSRSGQPRRLSDGDSIALDPSGRNLFVKQFGRDPIRLIRLDTVSGRETELHVPASLRLTSVSLSPTAVDAHQRIVLDTTSPLTWFYRPGVLDTASGTFTSIPLSAPGDCMAPGWTGDGRIVCAGSDLTGSLWRYVRR